MGRRVGSIGLDEALRNRAGFPSGDTRASLAAMRFPLLLAVFACLAAPLPAAACSPVPGYAVPTNMELTAEAELILLAAVTGGTPMDEAGAPDTMRVDIQPIAALKGNLADAPKTLPIALATGRFATLSNPYELQHAHPLAYIGGCVRYMVPVSYTHLDVYKRQMRKTLMTLAAGAAIVAVPAVAQVGLGGAANLNAGAALDPAATVGSVTDRVGQTVDSVDGAANDAVDSAKLTLATREQVRAGAQVTDAKGASIGTVQGIDGDNAIVIDGGKLYNVPLSALYSQADSVTGPLVTKLPKADLSVRAAGAAEAR